MLNPSNVIEAINRATNPFLMSSGLPFCLSQFTTSSYRLQINGDASTAFNNYGNDGEQVKVIKWFDDFWLFVEIQFLKPVGTIISLSVFQGEDTNQVKTQLFRAEWDDYCDGNTIHPQPHWHFLTNKLIENSAKEFTELLSEEKETFMDFLDEEINKTVDLSKFHFAMNGDWFISKKHVHEIHDENSLSSWFGGLLGYLKSELEFLQSKRL